MKRLILLIFLLIISSLFSQQIEIEKLDDFMIAQFYQQRDNVIAEDGYLYTLSSYGLEIYEIGNNGEITSLSRLPILISNSIKKSDNYIYISSGDLSESNHWGKLYQINVTDKQNPIIEQELDFEYNTWPLEVYGDMLNVKMYNVAAMYYINRFYSLPDLSLIAQHQDFLNHIDKLNETTALRFDGYNQFTIFDISDPVNPAIVGNGDVSAIHPMNIHRIITYNDTILICSVNELVSFWNVIDWNNWEYISQYPLQYSLFNDFKPLIIDSVMILVEFGYVELLDLTDINNPEQLFILSGTANHIVTAYIAAYNDNLYITTNYNGIQRLKLIDNTLSFENEYTEYYFAQKIVQVDNFIITSHSQNCYQIYDYSDPNNPNELGDFIPLYNPFFESCGNRFAVFQEDTFDYDIFDITLISNPVISNQINCDYYNICRFDQTDQNSIYFVDTNYNLRKFDISIPGINELVINEVLNFDVYNCIMHNGFGYFLESTGINAKRLYVFEGLDTNQPILINTINNFVSNPYARFKIIDNMLVIYTEMANDISLINRTKFFNIENPTEPVLDFEINAYGQPFIKDDLILSASSYICYVFQKEENSTGLLEPFNAFYDISNINYIGFQEYNNEDYLILCEASHTGIYSYEYTPSAVDDEIPISVFKLTNYPNPFNPSTTISFSIPESGQVTLEIYNIKGQKVKTLIDAYLSRGEFSATWNGRDGSNKSVASGEYIAKLKVVGDNVIVQKMILLK